MKKAIVVGSGAGGCMAARELSRSFEVTVLEAGAAFEPFAYPLKPLEPVRKAGLLFDERMIQPLFPAMRVLKAQSGLVHVNGQCIGGTTTIATGNALRCDGALAEIGIHLDDEFAELEREVPQSYEHSKHWSDLTVRLFMAFEQLGFEPQVMAKFADDAHACTACGHCVLGCKFGAKWTADRLLEGCRNITVRSGCTVKRLLIEDGQARGVEFVQGIGRRSTLTADVVVVCAGGLNTPVILNASGIATQHSFFSDPVICVAAPWKGAHLEAQVPMPFASQREGYILSPYFDWLSFFFNKSWRSAAADLMSIMVKYADSSQGSFDGKRLDKPLTAHDEAVIKRSVEEASQVFDCMGVKREELFLGTLNAGHPGGCLPLTERESRTLHHEVLPANVYVADATLFPHSMGNPPILTIMALAKRVARICAAELA